ncbi:MAG: roadblock/LC7 domain-containing protein [Nitrospinota bacterium]
MGKDDASLREENLSFYSDDMEKINKLLANFLDLSKAKSVFLIDKSGNMLTHKGAYHSINPDELSALVAASFAATKEIARLLGEAEFSVMFHQGKKDNIHISLIGNRAISAALFSDNTTAGMIGHYAKDLSQKLSAIFDIIVKRSASKEDMKLGSDIGTSVEDKLDDIFKG